MTASATSDTGNAAGIGEFADPIGIAQSPDELRRIFQRSRYAPLVPALSFAPYFPRSAERMLADARRLEYALVAIAAVAGIIVAAIVVSFWRSSIVPFAACAAGSLFVLFWVKRIWMGHVYGKSAEASKFIELICFDSRRPIVYLRRFESENPAFPTEELRHGAYVRSDNPAGEEHLENLATWLEPCGPMLGLGRPTDTCIDDRALRLFVANESWQDAVRFFLSEAKAVFLHYEPSAALDWELTQSLAARQAVVFVLLTDIPADIAQDEEHALAALPEPIQRLGLPAHYECRSGEELLSERYCLLATITADTLRLYGIKQHWKSLLGVVWDEVVHKLKLTESNNFANVPAAYRRLATVNQTSPWPLLAFPATLVAALYLLFRLF